jgi:hypothetical protein
MRLQLDHESNNAVHSRTPLPSNSLTLDVGRRQLLNAVEIVEHVALFAALDVLVLTTSVTFL